MHPPLPSPTSEPLAGLVRAAQTAADDDSPAMNEIIRRFEPLARRIGRDLAKGSGYELDVEQAARLGLVRAVRLHDPERPGFPAYASIHMRGAALRELKRCLPREIAVADIEETVDRAQEGRLEDAVLDRLAPWGTGHVAAAVATLPPQRRALLDARYVADESLERIAARAGITVSAASQRLGTAHRAVERHLATAA